MSITYKPKKGIRAKMHGFMKRNATRWGRYILKNRRRKGRHKLTVSDE